jgi:oligo-alginate lyase
MATRAKQTMRALVIWPAVLAMGIPMAHSKTASVLVTATMRKQAVRNCETHAWARRYRDRLIEYVAPWMAMSDEQLWRLLPSQDMPRDAAVNRGDGCPKCGEDHYNAPYNPSRWRTDLLARPWQVQCANCKEWFPKNDFGAYYRSALDGQHKFRLGKGDKALLAVGPGAPASWADDGTGPAVDGKRWFFAANYAFRLWEMALDVMEKMAVVYTLTGDPAYAHKAAVLLDRMADLYPEMDFAPHFKRGMECSTGGSGRGRIQGKIWETWTVQKASLTYDHIYDALLHDAELIAFASGMSQAYGTGDKSSAEAVVKHVEDHLLKEFIIGIRDARIRGNPGMHHYAMACVAIALDDPVASADALDWLFAPKAGAMPFILNERLAREGFSDEAALGYARIPARTFSKTAELLGRYPAYEGGNLYRDYAKFRACFTMGASVRMLDSYSPNWGDGDKCMNFGRTGITIPVEMALEGFRLYGTPEIAREVWFANGKTFDNLFDVRPGRARGSEDVHFHLYAADPESVLADLQAAVGAAPATLSSYNSGGHGMAVLQAPWRENGRALAFYYGRMAGHGHHDRLNILLVAENVVMAPDMGYPLYCNGTWRKRFGWGEHVISHNTCMVNETNPSAKSWSGKTRLFDAAGPLRVVDVDGGEVYDGVSTYRRCLAMVDVDPQHSYVLDLFWIRGGTNHRLIQNGGGPQVTHSGLALTPQETGTYAGPGVAYGAEYDGKQTSHYAGTGFSYLEQVKRAQPEGGFWVDWRMVEPRRKMPEEWEAHLRVHNLSPVDEVALCDGIPPRFKGNPERLRYMLRSRFGDGLESQFISVLEPYGNEPFIRSVRPLVDRVQDGVFVAAVEVTLVSGVRDVLLVREESGTIEAGGVSMTGRIGLCRFAEGEVDTQAIICGERVAAGDAVLELPRDAVRGTLTGWDASDPLHVLLHLDSPLPDTALVGRTIVIQNQERCDASYCIEKVVDQRTVSIGDVSLVDRYVDRRDYSKGVVHATRKGDPFFIPLSAVWKAQQ